MVPPSQEEHNLSNKLLLDLVETVGALDSRMTIADAQRTYIIERLKTAEDNLHRIGVSQVDIMMAINVIKELKPIVSDLQRFKYRIEGGTSVAKIIYVLLGAVVGLAAQWAMQHWR